MISHRLNNITLLRLLFVVRRLTIDRSPRVVFDQVKRLFDQRQYCRVIEFFDELVKQGQTTRIPDQALVKILQSGAKLQDHSRALRIQQAIPSGLTNNPFILSSLVHMFMQCGDSKTAEDLFERCSQKSIHLYGAMMKGYVTNGEPSKAVTLFHRIPQPNEIILTVLFNACAKIGSSQVLELIKKTSSTLKGSHLNDPILVASLIDSLMKCGDVPSAEAHFNRIKTKTIELYGAMMKGYIVNDQPEKAIDVFHRIKDPNDVIFILLFNACAKLANDEALQLVKTNSASLSPSSMSNVRLESSLMIALIKCGEYDAAEIIFRRIEKSVKSYGILMNGFNDVQLPEKTLSLYEETKHNGILADEIIFLSVIKALSRVKIGRIVHEIVHDIPEHLLTNLSIQTSLIGMWAKIGSIERAKQIFSAIDQPTEYSFSSMINAYGVHGLGSEALEVFHRMPSTLINEVTYVCILNACSHSGLVDKAQEIFDSIENKTKKIYTTMVDCLSRAAHFDRAEALINEFEIRHQPCKAMYLALLSGARNHKNVQLAERLFARISNIFPDLQQTVISATVLLGNIYGSLGDMTKMSDLRSDSTRSGTKKVIGASWTAPDGELTRFRAHDQSHPRSTEIYAELKRMSQQLRDHGHQYDESYVTRMLAEDETIESVLCGHSEKLAIAWNFVVNPHAKLIEVSKNLRVCPDCHAATKLLARIRQCEFIINDANRLHHVTMDGRCSCGDYF